MQREQATVRMVYEIPAGELGNLGRIGKLRCDETHLAHSCEDDTLDNFVSPSTAPN